MGNRFALWLVISLTGLQLFAQRNNWAYNYYDNRAYIGVSIDHPSTQKAEVLGFPNAYGSYVTGVYAGSGAEKAGIQPFDYIIGINNDRVNKNNRLSDLLSKQEVGNRVDVVFIRQGKEMRLPVVLGEPSEGSPKCMGGFLGISQHDDDNDDELGVRVNVRYGHAAEAMGLQDDDVITAINGYPMVDWSDIGTAIDNLEPGTEISVSYLRDNRAFTVRGELGEQNESHSSRGYLGIYTGEMDAEKASRLGLPTPFGSYVKRVIPGSGAALGGLQALDYIVDINGITLSENRDLTQVLRKFSPGQQVQVAVIRKKQPLTINVVLGEEADDHEATDCKDLPFFGVSARHDNSEDAEKGVAVNVVGGSSAQKAGLQSGDVITAMEGYTIVDWGDLSAVINSLQPGSTMRVAYLRDGQIAEVSAVLGNECDEEGQSKNENGWYDYNYDATFEAGQNAEQDQPIRDMGSMQAEMVDMDEADVAAMQARGVDMPIVDQLSITAVNLFPNPNKGMFRLEFTLPNEGETMVRVFNGEGRLIYSFDLGIYQGQFSDDIDISQNGAGAYFLDIVQNGNRLTRKIVVTD